MTVAPTTLHGRAPHRPWLYAAGAVALLAAGIVIGLLIRGEVGDRSSGVEGSGVAATEVRDVAPFTAVDLAGSNDVTVHVGGKQSVVVSADDNLLDDVTTRVEGGKLVVGTAPGSFTTNVPMRVDVTVPALRALTLSGSGIVTAEGIDAKRLTVALPGSGILRASGSATTLVVDHRGSGDAQLEGVVASDVLAVLGGSGRIVVTATKSLDATVSGSGAIFYRGDPSQVTTSVTGSGVVMRG
jgi:putative autotransporter adhesin-like protein